MKRKEFWFSEDRLVQPGCTAQLLPKKHQRVVKHCASCLKHLALQRNSTLEVNYCLWRRSRVNEWQCSTILSFPLEIVVRILSQTLYRENAECNTSNGITSTSVREARPRSQLCNISKDRLPNNWASHWDSVRGSAVREQVLSCLVNGPFTNPTVVSGEQGVQEQPPWWAKPARHNSVWTHAPQEGTLEGQFP